MKLSSRVLHVVTHVVTQINTVSIGGTVCNPCAVHDMIDMFPCDFAEIFVETSTSATKDFSAPPHPHEFA